MLRLEVALAILAITSSLPAYSQSVVSFPHNYGEPSGDLSPEWQDYFQVKDPLPNVSFPLGRNWAGSIPVSRANQPNDTLFFWAFEKENGSFTAESTEPWGIWLDGGPGLSSLTGLFFDNGPLHINSDSSVVANNYSWDKIADYIWVDQPVGVGYSTVQKDGNVSNEDELSDDFLGFLTNLVKVFPNLKSRPLYLTGEDYAGKYIPYIAKAYFGLVDPPVNLTKIALGNPTLGSVIEFENLPTLSVIETFPQIIGYDTDVYQYFREQSHLCGYDLNLTYPQDGKFPTLNLDVVPSIGTTNAAASAQRKLKTKIFKNTLNAGMFPRHEDIGAGSEHGNEQLAKRDAWKRDLTGRPNGTIDPFYGCDLWFELVEYAINYTSPWKGHYLTDIDFGNLQDGLFPHAPEDASIFLNDNQTRAAIHAPTSKQWFSAEHYEFAGSTDNSDPSIEPMAFLDDLAANASEHGVGVVIYSRNEDSSVAHLGSQVVIQNTTFGGIQGFSRPPSTPWFDDDGDFAGIVHQERNWTYALIQGAGSSVSRSQQQFQKAFVLFREFVFGSNTTGLLLTTTNHSTDNNSVVGGENSTLADTILPAPPEIYVGSGTTQSTYVYPSETIAAWDSFFATARGSASSGAVPSATQQSGCAAVKVGFRGGGMVGVALGVAAVLVVLVIMG